MRRSAIERAEEKFEVGPAAAAFLREEIARRLPLYTYRPGFTETYVTTVYFDSRGLHLYRRAADSYDNNFKIRLKEYYYRDERGRPVISDRCYLELKERSDGRVRKLRLELPKTLLARFLHGDDIRGLLWSVLDTPAARDGDGASSGRKALAYDEIHRFLEEHEVTPASAVHYRRMVYQEREEELRITFDDRIAVYNVPPGLYTDNEALTTEILGEPKYRHPKVILEIKSPHAGYPDWLNRLLSHHSSLQLSKFTTSIQWLLRASGGSEARRVPGERRDEPKPAASPARPATQPVSMDETLWLSEPIE